MYFICFSTHVIYMYNTYILYVEKYMYITHIYILTLTHGSWDTLGFLCGTVPMYFILTLTHLVTMGQTGDKNDNCVVLSLWLATELCFLWPADLWVSDYGNGEYLQYFYLKTITLHSGIVWRRNENDVILCITTLLHSLVTQKNRSKSAFKSFRQKSISLQNIVKFTWGFSKPSL